MRLTVLKSKIHGAIVTGANQEYMGSISIDPVLMEGANILSNEQVHVWNVTNGERIITYAIPASEQQGSICINGAAAHLFSSGDKVIIATFCEMDAWKANEYTPIVLIMDGLNSNRVKEKRQ